MYFKRIVDTYLDNWIKKDIKAPILLVGIRQCGKTRSVQEFAKRNNLELIELNFWNNPELNLDFDGKIDVNTIINNISLRFPEKTIDPNKTLLFFDEIQECPRARLSFKNFEQDGRYKVIGSGSYLGINGYIIRDFTPAPVGCEEVFNMKTMNFEEFLWANGYGEEKVNALIEYFNLNKPIPDNINNIYKELFLKYISIGGFPKVIKEYISTQSIAAAYKVLNSIVYDMKSDFGRRKDFNNNLVFKTNEVARIHNVFDLIPTFLAKENKRFIVSKISTGKTSDKKDAIEYLKQAHIVSKVHNVEVPSLPLAGQKIESKYKLFPNDIGIVTSMYGIETVAAINRNNLGQGKGAIYEAAVFDSLYKGGIETYYYAKDTGLEIDFVIAYKGYSTLVEAKAKTGNTKSSKTVMKNVDHYGKTKLIKIGDYNISKTEDIITIPHYLTFILGKE